MNDKTLKGGCHCGDIRYEIEGRPQDCGYCHCRDCQKTSGAPAQVWMDVRAEKFKITNGEPSIYQSSETGRRHFCAICGSQLCFSSAEDPEMIYPNAGCLDDPNLVKPKSHIWVDRQISWFDPGKDLPHYPRDFPEESEPQSQQ